ncbi:MAG TPA: hypothetical protein PK191_04975 [Niabella sp.]|nr:hypothetical protein [Niabella sp.]HOZ98324.1 hypothetical protein [Niabella sp.]HQW13403.1 hypothetical protein [Niabella sp.]HQX18797.1 hypothetical protein [Niabella sp.]HQX42028.1 hypothetical protein [Niabella sp.]
MKKLGIGLLALACSTLGFAQNGKENIDKLCGCFEVSFKYAETFSPDKEYKFHDRETIAGVTELALPLINNDKRVVIQHLLVMTSGMVIKHWREDWTYENPVQWVYKGDKVWEKITLSAADVKGKWSQAVWEVSDAPRYQGSAPWQLVNGHSIWENTADAPLPRREYTHRSDYNVLNRTNRLVINGKGYDHIQDNAKISRTKDADKLIAEEKGLNQYIKLSDTDCLDGKQYWETHKGYWLAVQQEWDKLLSSKKSIKIDEKETDKTLMTSLFALADDWKAGKLTAGNVHQKIQEVLSQNIR